VIVTGVDTVPTVTPRGTSVVEGEVTVEGAEVVGGDTTGDGLFIPCLCISTSQNTANKKTVKMPRYSRTSIPFIHILFNFERFENKMCFSVPYPLL
jgi:hypothetical protein